MSKRQNEIDRIVRLMKPTKPLINTDEWSSYKQTKFEKWLVVTLAIATFGILIITIIYAITKG